MNFDEPPPVASWPAPVQVAVGVLLWPHPRRCDAPTHTHTHAHTHTHTHTHTQHLTVSCCLCLPAFGFGAKALVGHVRVLAGVLVMAYNHKAGLTRDVTHIEA